MGHFEWFSKSCLIHSTNTVIIFECICIFDKSIKQWLISPLWEVPVALSHLFSFTVYARAWWSAFMHPLTVWLWWHISEKGGAYTNQGPSRDKDSTINDSMTYTVIKMNNSMIKKNKTIKTIMLFLGCFFFKFLKRKKKKKKRLFKISIFSQLKVQKNFWKEDKDWKLTLDLLISSNNVFLASKKWVWCDSARQ